MKNSLHLLLVGVSAALGASNASAVTVLNTPSNTYTFTGVCAVNDCAGVGVATLTLNFPSFVLSQASFKSFTYQSSLVSYAVTTALVGTMGDLSTTPGTAAVTINGGGYIFRSELSGRWTVAPVQIVIADPTPIDLDPIALTDLDNGPTHAWVASTAVPEPATWAMMVGGFGLIGGAMRRRKVAVVFA